MIKKNKNLILLIILFQFFFIISSHSKIDIKVKVNNEIITNIDIKKEIAPLLIPPKIQDEPEFYMDFGSDTSYHTVTGKGECAA